MKIEIKPEACHDSSRPHFVIGKVIKVLPDNHFKVEINSGVIPCEGPGTAMKIGPGCFVLLQPGAVQWKVVTVLTAEEAEPETDRAGNGVNQAAPAPESNQRQGTIELSSGIDVLDVLEDFRQVANAAIDQAQQRIIEGRVALRKALQMVGHLTLENEQLRTRLKAEA